MKEDLHLTKEVRPPHADEIEKEIPHIFESAMKGAEYKNTVGTLKIDVDADEQSLPLPIGMSLPDSVGLFVLPKCHVSNSIFKLTDLVEETLKEAIRPGIDSFYAGRLVCTARNIFEMYQDVLPITHRDTLANFPQSSALAYNNCMYLAHQCLTIGPSVLYNGQKLPPPLNTRTFTFADLVPRLRRIGVEIFLQQMRRQRDQLRTMLRDSSAGLGQLSGDHLLPPAAEKCIRQVLYQLNHLRKVWTAVLPNNIYKRAIGTILNSVVEELVERVIILEDIAADSAVQICALFSLVRDKAHEVFMMSDDEHERKDTSKMDLIRYVKKWNQFKELILLLNASLKEIEDRWAGGKGPLAVEFTVEEVKKLVRALFQNTDRRAATLSRIKFES